MRIASRFRLAAAVVGLVAVCVACDPGWTNPAAGTGDGSAPMPGSQPVPSDQVSFGEPFSLVDLGASGYLIYDSQNCTITRVAHDVATRYAGDGACGDTGDGGPATQAQISVAVMPLGARLQVDPAGNVYFASTVSGNIRRIDALTGVITTLATKAGFVFGISVEANGDVTYLKDSSDEEGASTCELRRIDGQGHDMSVATCPGTGIPVGFARVAPGHYVTFAGDTSSGQTRVDFDHGVVTTTDLALPMNFIPEDAGPDGSIYGITYDMNNSSGGLLDGNFVVRLSPDNVAQIIAGSGVPDDGTHRQTGQGLDLDLSATAVAYTRNGNLLISSGHVVYALDDADAAPAGEPLELGQPLNNIGGPYAAIDKP